MCYLLVIFLLILEPIAFFFFLRMRKSEELEEVVGCDGTIGQERFSPHVDRFSVTHIPGVYIC